MKLVWMFCLLLVGTLAAATPSEERATAESSLGSGYMMAFPMDDKDQLAEESATDAAKMIAVPPSLASSVDDDDDDDDDDDAKSSPADQNRGQAVLLLEVEDDKKGNDDAKGQVVQAEIVSADDQPSQPMPEPLFRRPKIEELRKILGFPQAAASQKVKPIPQEKPKVFQGLFNKPRPKIEPPAGGGLQFSLPLRREDGFRPFGLPDLVHAASAIIRRAIIDDNDAQDISKEDKDDDDDDSLNDNDPENEEDEEEDDDDEPLMIVPVPEGKEMPEERPSIFRRLPIPIPIPIPRPMGRSRLPFPPLTPVAFLFPLAQQIMQSFAQKPSSRSHPPLIPLSPLNHIMPLQPPMQHLVPIQAQFPIVPIHPPMQHIVPFPQPMPHLIPLQQPMPQLIPLHQPFPHIVPLHPPIIPLPQPALHIPFITPLPPQMPRPVIRPMPRRVSVHPPPPPPPHMGRRIPMPSPQMGRMAGPPMHPTPHGAPPMVRRPVPMANGRPMPRVVRPPMPPVHPVLFLMSPMPVPMHVPVAHPQPMPVPIAVPDEERIIFIRPTGVQEQEDQDDDQSEVLLLYPSEEMEVARRPQFVPRPMMRPLPPPPSPLQRIRLLRDLLLARQANRQGVHPLSAARRASRVVEIVQQQLRIFPVPHPGQPMQHPSRADASEPQPVYVPFVSPQ